jgi:hypothetical protein
MATLQNARRVHAARAFAGVSKRVECMVVTDIFIVRKDATVIRLSSYNAIVIASVS